MAFSPALRSAPLSGLPSARFALLDELDQQFGHVVDESDMGYWSSDLECGSDWDRSGLSSEDLEDVCGVYGEGEALAGYFDSLSTFDSDDYEYQQSLLY